jgi:nitrous-oxide reductase
MSAYVTKPGRPLATYSWVVVALALVALYLFACGPKGEGGGGGSRRGGGGGSAASGGETGSATAAATATYVNPGDLDDMYLFYSGGHSGQIYVAGIPSMRHISTIPVFTPYPATGYGFDDDSKKMLGDFTWGDAHHPSLSKTNGDYDGRWIFIGDNANNRLARVDLRDFKTKQIIGPIPNCSGNHGHGFVTANSEYALYASRFSVPIPNNTGVPVAEYKEKYKGVVGGIKIDPTSGNMSYGWQIITPPFNWDLGSTGRGPSADWAFWTCYNSEEATGELEKTSTANDRDYTIAVNWKLAAQAVADGKADKINGMDVLDPAKVEGLCYLISTPKSPHGVDVGPDGTFFVASGKLEAVTTVFGFQEMVDAIAAKKFTGDEAGIPVLDDTAVKLRDCQIGLGPLHTQYDDQGYAYTSLFVDSAIAKWDPKTGEVLDTIPVTYNVGHLMVPGGDTMHPYGKYVISLNKLSHGQHLNVGPSQPESTQLIDISGDKMKMLYLAFTEPEPHYAEACPADLLHPIEVYPKEENTNPNAIWDVKDAAITRNGTVVDVKMAAVRSTLYPTEIQVNKGDKVSIHITNIEQTTDELHGFAICEYNINLVIDPGETKSVTFTANKSGVFPFYCTNFCSALHQEMQGYFIVK